MGWRADTRHVHELRILSGNSPNSIPAAERLVSILPHLSDWPSERNFETFYARTLSSPLDQVDGLKRRH